MGISLRKYTECSAKNKRSYQIRTGQIKLPVRKIEPVQYVDSKTYKHIKDLVCDPIAGECYIYNGFVVLCVVAKKGNEVSRCKTCELFEKSSDCYILNCSGINRADREYVYLRKLNA